MGLHMRRWFAAPNAVKPVVERHLCTAREHRYTARPHLTNGFEIAPVCRSFGCVAPGLSDLSFVKACGLLRVALKRKLPKNEEDMRAQLEHEEKTLSPGQLAEVAALENLYSTPEGLEQLLADITSVQ